MTKTEVYELCEENPEKWETVANDCLDNMAFDDIEDACRRSDWKLPLTSYLDYFDLIRLHVKEICRQDPKMWEKAVRMLIDYMPAHFVEYLSEEYGW